VADDDQQLCESLKLLLQERQYDVRTAPDGRRCLEVIKEYMPDVLVLDLAMPHLDGFGVLQEMEVLEFDGQLPDVIVLTGHGGISDGARAIKSGAIGFLTKPARNIELLTLISRAVAGRRALDQKRAVFTDSKKHWECAVSCHRENIRHVVNQIAAEIEAFGLILPKGIRRILMAVDEGVTNAIIHGGLEVGSILKERTDPLAFEEACAEREGDPNYADRRVRVALDIDPEELVIVVEDQGPGFEVGKLPDPDDPEALLMASGRGIIIMQALLDEVRFEDSGRRAILIQRAPKANARPTKQVI
jgi:FixJ family two-component response regulator